MKKIYLIVCFLFAAFFIKAQDIPAWKITDVANYYSKKTDSVYVINFWATSCKPCAAQIPYLQNITNKYGRLKVKLLLVSLDRHGFYPRKVRNFAKKNNFVADIAWLNETDADHFCPVIDNRWNGAVPATLFVNPATGYKKFIETAMREDQFEKELRRAIGKD
jgi:thiol-disulfide isomerase/thioredoxin